MMPADIVKTYLDKNYRIVTWPQIGDTKGPRDEGWTKKIYQLADYSEGYRVGIMTGTEVAPGKYLHDVDIDWSPGAEVALRLLPDTGFVFGRSSKRISHCFYLAPEPIPSYKYEDIDKTSLIEIRGTKLNGDLGFQTMVPPSIWTKEKDAQGNVINMREELQFIKFGEPSFIEKELRQTVTLAAIGMLLAKHFGKNGFGHEPRLAWAGFLLRAGIPTEPLIKMGEAISLSCNNLEIQDVRRTVESTASRLTVASQKIKGGPNLARILGSHGKAVIAKINEWLGRDSDFLRSSDGTIIKDSQENIRRALALMNVEVSNQAFAERLLIKEADKPVETMTDGIITDLWLRIDRDYRFRPSYVFFEKVVTNTANSNSFHPVRDYLQSLPNWDGTPRIEQWLIHYARAEDTRYTRAVSRIVLIAAVKRILQPGCKYDEMLVLESGQGMNKSSALRALCPNPDWFSDDLPLNVDAKQIIERTLGKWIIEASDLSGNRRTDRDHLKAMLSRQVDGPARMAYAHFPVERARQFIIIGTTNNAAYLADQTGARRFWPIAIKEFDVDAIARDRDQLWAEAKHFEAEGESIRLARDLWGDAQEEQEKRREVDAWEHVIEENIARLKPKSNGTLQISTEQLWSYLQIPISARDRISAIRISEIMQRLGFNRTKVYLDKKTQAGYTKMNPGYLPVEGEAEPTESSEM